MARASNNPDQGGVVLTQICMNCGQEYYFESGESQLAESCERCGGQVFRSFYDSARPDEVEQDFDESTHRDTATDDPGTDITPGDLHDLNNP